MSGNIEYPRDLVDFLNQKYKDKFWVDHESGKLKFDGIQAFWSRSSLLYAIHKELRVLIGEAADAVMHMVTKPHGRTFIEFAMKEFGELEKEEILTHLVADLMATGWGMVRIIPKFDGYQVIAPKGFPIGQQFLEHNEASEEPVDHYFLGYFEGAFSMLDGIEYTGREVLCVASGAGHCEFVFRPTED